VDDDIGESSLTQPRRRIHLYRRGRSVFVRDDYGPSPGAAFFKAAPHRLGCSQSVCHDDTGNGDALILGIRV
jgi:hypothetical protein